MSEGKHYLVVFEGQGGSNSNYKGIRTIVPFQSEAHFNESQKTTQNRDLVIAQGVSDEEARSLASQTSIEARFNALEHEQAANPDAASMYLFNMRYALQRDLEQGYRPPSFDEEDGE